MGYSTYWDKWMRINSIVAFVFAMAGMIGATEKAQAGFFLSITVAPPPLPIYDQPPIPGPGYIWTPGYWSWDDEDGDYYWVPGAWAPAPEPGLLWTPGYWGWNDGVYAWNGGYWGPHVGFYGGICYGFGYTGVGFEGGHWEGRDFAYNRSVTNISNTTIINNTYIKNVTVNNTNIRNVSFNGGQGGIQAQPTAQEKLATNETHIPPGSDQLKHQQLAAKNPDLKASKNQGKPPIAAVSKPGDFSKANVLAAKGAGAPFKATSLKTNTSNAGKQFGAVGNANSGNKSLSKSNGNTIKNANANLNVGSGDRHKSVGRNFSPPAGRSPRGSALYQNPGDPSPYGFKKPSGPGPYAFRNPGGPGPQGFKKPGGPGPYAFRNPGGPGPQGFKKPGGPGPQGPRPVQKSGGKPPPKQP
jgi:hypothetical protein